RDNDPVAGPKWGKSAITLILLPQVGEPEALRYAALVKVRDALTDVLDDRITAKSIKPGGGKDHAEHEKKAHAGEAQALDGALSGSYGGLTFPGRTARFTRVQLRRLEQALEAEKKAPSDATHKQLVHDTEEVLLLLDSAVHGLGARDSRSVARRLATVADEA